MSFTLNILKNIVSGFDPEPQLFMKDEGNPEFSQVRLYSSKVALEGPDCLYVINGNKLCDLQKEYVAMGEELKDYTFICVGFGQKMLRVINRLPNCRIILIKGKEDDLVDVYNFVSDRLAKMVRWSARLDSSVYNNEGMQALVDLANEYFWNPILVYDPAFSLIACSKPDPKFMKCDIVKRIMEDGYIPKEITDKFVKYNGLKYDKHLEEGMVFYNPEVYPYKIVIKVFYSHENRKAVVMIPCCGRDAKISSVDMLNIVAKRMEHYIFKDPTEGEIKREQEEYFLINIIEDKINEESVIEKRAPLYGLVYKGKYSLTVIALKDYSISRAEYALYVLRTRNPNSKLFLYKNRIVMLSRIDKVISPEMLSARREVFRGFLEHFDATCGGSGTFYSLKMIKTAYVQATVALRLGNMINENERWHNYRDYYIYHMLGICSKEINIESLMFLKLKFLMENDRQTKMDNTQVLKVYINNNRNSLVTAKIMNLHRNSIVYRLKKIEEILGIDLNDINICVRLFISFKILELVSFLDGNAENEKIMDCISKCKM